MDGRRLWDPPVAHQTPKRGVMAQCQLKYALASVSMLMDTLILVPSVANSREGTVSHPPPQHPCDYCKTLSESLAVIAQQTAATLRSARADIFFT